MKEKMKDKEEADSYLRNKNLPHSLAQGFLNFQALEPLINTQQ